MTNLLQAAKQAADQLEQIACPDRMGEHYAVVRRNIKALRAAIAAEDDEAPLSPHSGLTSPTSRRTSVRLPRSGSDRTLSPAAISRRNSLQNLAALRQTTEHLVRPRHPFMALLYDVQQALVHATQARVKTLRRTMSSIMYTSERDQLLSALLDWAKHDKQNQVSEPRNNLTRWRTAHEWKALRAGGVQLGLHDSTERAAFAKFSFVFAGKLPAACRAVPCVMMTDAQPAALFRLCCPRLVVGSHRPVAEAVPHVGHLVHRAPDGAAVRVPDAAGDTLRSHSRGFGR